MSELEYVVNDIKNSFEIAANSETVSMLCVMILLAIFFYVIKKIVR